MENITSSNSMPTSVHGDARAYAAAGFAVLPVGTDGSPLPIEGTLAATRSLERVDKLWSDFPDADVGVLVGDGLSVVRIGSAAEQRFLSLADSTPATFPDGDGRFVLFNDDVLAVASDETIATAVTLLGPGEIVKLPRRSTWRPVTSLGAGLLSPPPKWLIDTYEAWERDNLDQQAQRFVTLAGLGNNDFVELIALGKPTMGAYATAAQLGAVANLGCASCYGNGIYVLAQGLDPALLHRVDAIGAWTTMSRRATDSDVLATRYFYIDIDPNRTPDTSATAAERAAAMEVADAAEDFLRRAAGDCFARVSSGNGVGFILPVVPFVPTGDMAAAWKGILHNLHGLLGTDQVKFDTTVFNASRLIPMPGTVKRKGRSASPRLHRRVQLDAGPDVRSDSTELVRRFQTELGQHATRHSSTAPQLRVVPHGAHGPSVQRAALLPGPVDVRAVAGVLGLAIEGDRVVCPGCGEPDALIGELGTKCFHARCAERGSAKNGFYTPTDMIEACLGVGKLDAKEKLAHLTGGGPSNIANIANQPWPDLQPLHDEAHGPPFPLDALPGVLKLWAESMATSVQVPADLPAVLAITAVASAAQRGYRVQVKEDWEMPVGLFTTVAMVSGARKSPVFRAAMQPIVAREKLIGSYVASRRRTALLTIAGLEKALEKAVDAALTDPKKAAEVARIEAQLSKQHVPVIPTLVVADSTPEAITALLAEQGGCLTVASPEGEIFEIITGRYSEAPGFEVLLKAYSGDDIKVARARREVVRIEDPAMTIALAVQPAVLYQAVSNTRLRSRGFIARFLMSVPPDNLGGRSSTTTSVTADIQRAYNELITSILGPLDFELRVEPARRILRFSEKARVMLQMFEAELEPELRPRGKLRHLTDWVAKLPGQIARMAALLHLASGYHSDDAIDVQTIKSAIVIGRYFLAHELVVFPHGPLQHAQMILDRLVEQNPITVRDLFERVKGSLRSATQLRSVLRYLAERDYIRIETSHGRVGRPSETVHLNPHFNSHNSQKNMTHKEQETTMQENGSDTDDLANDQPPPSTSQPRPMVAARATRTNRPRPPRLLATLPEAVAATRWAAQHLATHRPRLMIATLAEAVALLGSKKTAT